MILGLSEFAFTVLHTVISLVALVAGGVVVSGMIRAKRLPGWTALFLAATALTSITGFMFPIKSFTPALAFGVVSLLVLAAALLGLYAFHASGRWRFVYVIGALVALYLNAFVVVVQAFQKIAFLHRLAPTGSEPPFQAAQFVLLVLFVLAGVVAVRRFHPDFAAAQDARQFARLRR